MSEINVLIYDVPHRKSQQVLLRLKALGYDDVTAIVQEFEKRKPFIPLIPHRFTSCLDIHPKTLCERLGFRYVPFDPSMKGKFILLAGARLLPKEFTENNTVVNAHTGMLPHNRGLDAIKWAIIEGNPIGITTHVINDEIDAGMMIRQQEVQIFSWDTFHSVAYRLEELELQMLIDAIKDIKTAELKRLSADIPPKRRMPREMEERLLEKFEEYKKGL